MYKDDRQFSISDTITGIIIGMSDGIIIPFTIATGASRIFNENITIVTVASAVIAIGATATGISGFIAGKGEEHHYGEQQDRVYKDLGLSNEIQEAIATENIKDKEQWEAYVSTYGLSKNRPTLKQAKKVGVNIALTYVLGGLLPLFPYLIAKSPTEGVKWSVLVSLASLLGFGYFKASATGKNVWLGAFQLLMIGSVSGLLAYYVGGLFNG